MDWTRRGFLGAVPAAAAGGAGALRREVGRGGASSTQASSTSSEPGGSQAEDRHPPVVDPLGVRADFPVAGTETYLNGPYITPSPTPVVEAAARFLHRKAENPVSLGDMLGQVDRVRAAFADLVGARAEEVGTLFATSDGENVVTRALEVGPGDNVVVDDLHYETTYLLYQELARTRGVELRIVESVDGAAPAERYESMVDANTRLLSVSWVSHQNGYRHDLRALSQVAHDRGAYLYVDAIQGVGALELDVRQTDVDFLTTGTYKWLLGGFGVAPFYVRRELLDLIEPDRYGSLHIDGGGPTTDFSIYGDGRKYGYATMAFGAVYQLGAALEYLARVGVERIEGHTVPLARALWQGLADQGFHIRTPQGNQSPIVAFIHGRDPEAVARRLEDARVRVSLREEGTQIRAGIALFNTQEDVDRLLEVTAQL